jgi:hypothetical protein
MLTACGKDTHNTTHNYPQACAEPDQKIEEVNFSLHGTIIRIHGEANWQDIIGKSWEVHLYQK